MKFKNYLLMGAAMLATVTCFTACEDDDPENGGTEQPTPEPEPEPTPDPEEPTDPWASADVVTWPGDTIVNLSDHFVVPEGKSLVIEAGAQVIFSTSGVGANHVPIEFTVDGNLYCEGTEDAPVLFY